jgi:TolB-like protein
MAANADAPAPAGAAQDAASGNSAAARSRRLWRRIRAVAVVAALAAGITVLVLPSGEDRNVEHEVPAVAAALAFRPPLVVQPFESLDDTPGAAELAATLTEEIFLVLDGPERLVVPAEPGGEGLSTFPGYVLTGSVRESADGEVRITARIVRADTGTQIATAAYDERLDALRSAAGQRRIARLVALATEPYGPVFDAELERVSALAAHRPVSHDCVLKYYEYRRAFGAAEHATALDCFELVTAREPENAAAWAGLSLLTSDAFAHGFAGQGGSASILERARETARRAMDIDGENLRANLALAAVQYFGDGDWREIAERTLAAWPDNAEAQAFLGTMFLLTGETARGDALVVSAMEWTPAVPSGYYASRSLAALREQRYDDALALALRMDAPDWALGQIILAVAGALGGRSDLAARAHKHLLELDPAIATSLPDVLRRWRVEPVLAGEIERGFAATAKP